MVSYVVRRLLYAVVVVWGAVSLIFIVVRLIPGDPGKMYAGPLATADQVAAARTTLGLDRSIFVQYLGFLRDMATFHFGNSFRLGNSVLDLFLQRLPATALLAATAMTVAIILSFPLGILAAQYRSRAPDRWISLVSLLGQAIPNFWLGIVGILIFSVQFRWLPTGGNASASSLIMPSLVLAAPLIGVLVRLIRAGLIDTMGEPYILTARAKGLTTSVILFRHAIKNSLIPVVTVMGLELGQLLSGAVVVEVVFAWPGLGRLLVDAITNRDFPVVQGVILFVSVVFVLINLLVDLSYGWLDPRIRLEGSR